jgi:anti-sigma factor (TIGR02949 family)
MGEECDALLQNIADLLHGELDAHSAAQLRSHLDDCPPCFETADFQAHLRQIVAKRCFEEVPGEFKARLVAMLAVEVRSGDSSGSAPRS